MPRISSPLIEFEFSETTRATLPRVTRAGTCMGCNVTLTDASRSSPRKGIHDAPSRRDRTKTHGVRLGSFARHLQRSTRTSTIRRSICLYKPACTIFHQLPVVLCMYKRDEPHSVHPPFSPNVIIEAYERQIVTWQRCETNTKRVVIEDRDFWVRGKLSIYRLREYSKKEDFLDRSLARDGRNVQN